MFFQQDMADAVDFLLCQLRVQGKGEYLLRRLPGGRSILPSGFWSVCGSRFCQILTAVTCGSRFRPAPAAVTDRVSSPWAAVASGDAALVRIGGRAWGGGPASVRMRFVAPGASCSSQNQRIPAVRAVRASFAMYYKNEFMALAGVAAPDPPGPLRGHITCWSRKKERSEFAF